MDRAESPRTASRRHTRRSQRGASIVEAVIALPILLVVILGAIQFGLVYEAKATLNHASLQAARLGAVRNAQPAAIRRGLARGLAPLHSPDASLTAISRTITRLEVDLRTDARIRILNPTREAFGDFGVDVDGEREIPNDRLHARSASVGAQSGINIQDANLLKIEITYGYELQVPLVNWFIARVLLGVSRATDSFEQQLLRRTHLPIIATTTVRMQSPARLNDSMVSINDFPDIDRIPSNAAPPPVSEEQEEEDEPAPDGGDTSSDPEDEPDRESSLDDGFLGFGGGAPPISGGGGSGGIEDGGLGGGLNGGNPSQCSAGGATSPFPAAPQTPGDHSIIPGLLDRFDTSKGGGANLDSVALASLSVGNPIHVVTGNKYQQETDIDWLPGVLGIGFQRHYNSAAVRERSVMGAGWRHSYQATLRQLSDGSIQIVQADGRLLRFEHAVAVQSEPSPLVVEPFLRVGAPTALVHLAPQRSREARLLLRIPAPAAFGHPVQQVRGPDSVRAEQFLAQRASDGVLSASADGYIWRWRSGRELHFDPAGRLIRMRDHSNELTLRYDDAGDLISVIDPQERQLRFEYHSNGRLASVRGPGKIGIHYAYDADGNLAQAAGNDGNARRYIYEDERHPNHLSGILVGSMRPLAYGERKPFERIATWAYDERGRAVFSSHPDDAGKVTLSFGKHETEVTDAFGRTTRYRFDWRGGTAYVRELRGPGCGSCGQGDSSYDYDERFQPIRVATKAAPVLTYRYDSEGRVTQTGRVIAGKSELLARYEYDGVSSRITRIERPSVKAGAMAATEIEYTSDGAVTSTRELGFAPYAGAFDAIERSSSFAYDDRTRLIRIDGPRTDADDRMDIEYDDFGRIIAIKTPAGESRIVAHDAAGRPTRVTQTGRPDIKLHYDMRGRVTSVTQVRSDGELKVVYQYDVAGRLAQVTDPLGRRVRYGFDASGRPTRMSRSDSNMVAVAHYGPDDRIERIGALGANGQLLRTLYYAYDSQRRLTEIRDGDGQALQRLGYLDDDALPDRKIDPLGHETSLQYDTLGQLASVLAPDGGSTRFERDNLGRTTLIEGPNKAATSFVYDDFGRRVFEQSSDRGVTKYAYDAAGNLIEKTDARGARTRFSYDAANRLIKVQRAEGTSTLAYANGLLTAVDGEASDERYEYDVNGQVIEHTRVLGHHSYTTRFTYDAQGRLGTRDLPSGARLRYRYAHNGSLRSITQERWLSDRVLAQAETSGSSMSAKLTSHGPLTFGNGLSTRTTFDAITGNISRRAVEHVALLAYEHDDAGRITEIRRDKDARKYQYDSIGRLTLATTRRGISRFEYDQNGNRISSTYSNPAPSSAKRGPLEPIHASAAFVHPAQHRDRQGATSSQHDLFERIHATAASARPAHPALEDATSYEYAVNSNRITSIISDTAISYGYDAAGNPLSSGARRYEYDTNGRVTKLFDHERLIAEYRYNFWGERVQKIVHAHGERRVTSFIYEQQKLVAEADDGGNVTREYIYLDQHPVAMLDKGKAYWIHTDHLGTPIAVSDSTRTLVWKADHQPFGEAAIDSDPDGDKQTLVLNLRFPGQYADAESGTHYNYFRDYDPKTGRYLTSDPIGMIAGTNSYAYVNASPLDHHDLLGLYDAPIHYYMTYFLGIVAGLPQDVARTVAVAAYYIDQNPFTKPATELINANELALPLYHFVMSSEGPYFGDDSTDMLRRFYNPDSDQLSNLLNAADPARLAAIWSRLNPNACPMPQTLPNARYQLLGEYIHAYEDTFSHRDLVNTPYGIDPTITTHPVATYGGHTGLYNNNPLQYEQPDKTNNQDEDDVASVCVIRYVLGGVESRENITEGECEAIARSPTVATTRFTPRPSKCVQIYFRSPEDLLGTRAESRGLTESECMEQGTSLRAIQTHYLPNGEVWAYNELRTLRMEHELLGIFREQFGSEIDANTRALSAANFPLPSIDWSQLAGRQWDERNPADNSRTGLEQSYDQWRRSQGLSASTTVLQLYNSSDMSEPERLDILNKWLRAHDFRDTNGAPIQIELWRELAGNAADARWQNIGWIPAGSLTGVLLPRDETCIPVRNLPENCDDRQRR
jgi:RHS repeat-associated protein